MFQVLFSTQGRIARLPYLGYTLLLWLVVCIVFAGGFVIFDANGDGGNRAFAITLMLVASLALVWSGTVLMVKRFHDMDRSGWNVLWFVGLNALSNVFAAMGTAAFVIYFVITLLFSLWVIFSPGTKGPNRFDAHSRVSPTSIEPATA